jgi:hypothetical protein
MNQEFRADDFQRVLHALADAWARNDAPAAAALFREDASYMEPPGEQLFLGRDQLRAYFSPLEPGTYLDIHHAWYDEGSGYGSLEFTFGTRGETQASHGMAVVQIVDGLIASWREYQAQGPSSFAEFTAIEGKQWRWHIGNYP